MHSLTYDESDRIIAEAYDGVTAYSYSYNTEGYLGKTIDHSLGVTTYYDYDLVGRVTDVDSSDGVSSDFSYNDKNSIAGYSVAKNNTVISKADYTYNDTSGLLTGVTTDNGTYNSFSYNYDGLNRLTSLSHAISGTSFNTNYAYTAGTNSDTTGLVSSISYMNGSNKFMPTLGYTYDGNGNISKVTKNGTTHITYTYDSLNRLVREDNKDLNETVTYTYDARGNILNKKTYAYTTGSLTNATVTDTVTYSYDSTWKDKLTSFDEQSISYDNIGNPTTYRGASLTWEKGRQLKSIGVGNTTVLSFEYNAEGLRTEKAINYGDTTTYTWSSGLLMQQSDGTNTLNFSYSPDGRPLGVKFNGTNYYYIYNLQGDVIGLYNTAGTVVVQYTYDSWGVLLSTTGSLASTLGFLNPFRYRGYIYDEETELYYLRSRYYDPEIGRFLNVDGYVSTGTGLSGYNMFAYCNNNPVNNVDKYGTSVTAVVLTIGAIILGAGLLAGAILGFKSEEKLINVNKENNYNNCDSKVSETIIANQGINNNVQNNYYSTNQPIKNNTANALEEELTLGDRVLNAVIGAGVGLAVAGGIVALVGAGYVVIQCSIVNPLATATAARALFAMGAIAFDTSMFIIGPMLGLSTEPIEGIESNLGGK